MNKLSNQVVNNIRAISATMIANAGSGHTGIALGATPIFYSLFNDAMKYFPNCPEHNNRDRFVLDSGHSSALLFATLHAFGFNYSKTDLKNFRKMGSITHGHPSLNPSLGVDASSGPLGQGIPMAVGMAIAEKKLASRFNKPNLPLVNHHTFCFCGDGGLMEGITNEASSLAGSLGLNKLIVIYDSNNITIEGKTELTFTENVLARYRALGWNTIEVENGEDTDAISSAIMVAKQSKEKPTLIKVNTKIGFGTPYEGLNKIHGMALKEEDLVKTIKSLGVSAEPFEFEQNVEKLLKTSIKSHNDNLKFETKIEEDYKKKYPQEYAEYLNWFNQEYSKKLDIKKLSIQNSAEETRTSSFIVLNEIAKQIPNLIVGSADLAPSTKSDIVGGGDFSKTNPNGRNIHFGVREHSMASIANGIALHGGLKIAVSTFMVFSDYMRHAIRMSALMKLPVIYILTHDSIAVGEDGKTHQPVEYNAMHRATPNLTFIRPANREEVKFAYGIALNNNCPTILSLTRQKTPILNNISNCGAQRGAYVVANEKESADVVIYSSGSELSLAIDVSNELRKHGIIAKVVSVPSIDLFEKQISRYKSKIMSLDAKLRVAIEASNDPIWYKFIGIDGLFFGVDSFGFTASKDELLKHFGLTKENIVKAILRRI